MTRLELCGIDISRDHAEHLTHVLHALGSITCCMFDNEVQASETIDLGLTQPTVEAHGFVEDAPDEARHFGDVLTHLRIATKRLASHGLLHAHEVVVVNDQPADGIAIRGTES